MEERGVIEADPPLLSPYAPVIDVHIDPMKVDDAFYLQTSPEFGLKRLLGQTELDLYFLGHVFRKAEKSHKHRPEFTMVEWYRREIEEMAFHQEVLDLLSLFIAVNSFTLYSFQELMEKYVLPSYPLALQSCKDEHPTWDSATIKDYLFSHYVQPHLGNSEISIITHFPLDDAQLAKTEIIQGIEVARRFEYYYEGLELANGYHELTSREEHQRRFEENNCRRKVSGKDALPIDIHFLNSLDNAPFPETTYGIAVGFDRLLMLHTESSDIASITPL